MRWGVVRFPGSLDDSDTLHALTHVLGQDAEILWHKDRDLRGADCVVLPGGFSYGDYLRPGALARFAPIMQSVVRFARDGGLVLGICNGFQVLCEAGLLPGALMRNRRLSFVCAVVHCRIDETDTPFTKRYNRAQVITLPIKHGHGCYVADAETLRQMEDRRQIILRYVDASGRATDNANPNGSLRNIAGIVSRERNVFGLMPHPEHACEALCGGVDGVGVFQSIRAALLDRVPLRDTSVPPGL